MAFAIPQGVYYISIPLRKGLQVTSMLAKIVWCGLSIVALFAITMLPAAAYLDPTTSSFVVQAVAGTILALIVTVKKNWRWLKVKISGKVEKDAAEESDG